MDKKIAILLNVAAKHGIRDPNLTDVIQDYFKFSKVRSLIKIIVIIVSTNNKI